MCSKAEEIQGHKPKYNKIPSQHEEQIFTVRVAGH